MLRQPRSDQCHEAHLSVFSCVRRARVGAAASRVSAGKVISRADKVLLGGAATLLGSAAWFGPGFASLGVPALALIALVTDGVARASSSVLYPTVTRGPKQGNKIALTFDDGPDPEVTPAVLDVLRQHGVRSTFFTIGRLLEQQPLLAQRIAAEGHELGNHSWQHSRWQNFFSARRHAADMERSERAIAKITGANTTPLFRPPVGLKSPELARAAHPRGIVMVAWSLHSRDTRTADPVRIADRVLRRIMPGDIVLMHDGHDLPGRHRPACAAALALILTGLKAKGLLPVPVSELLGRVSDLR